MTNLLDIITPLNLASEQDRFLSSSNYNPQFHYLWQDNNLEPKFSIEKKYPLWQAIREQNHQYIVKAASNLFEVKINPQELSEARKYAQIKAMQEYGTAKEYASLMRNALDQFGLHNFVVEIVNQIGFNSRPNHRESKLVVSDAIHFEYFSMEGGVHHELAHILRYINGKHNGIKRSQRFLPTEEGLASWCQDHANDDNGMAQHAMEYLVTEVALNGSLRDIYNSLRDLGMSSELAWKRACRHKFGFVDTSQTGDILKPAMYFANELKVDKLTTNERVKLFIGKINQDELIDYPNYRGLWPAEQLINYFHL